MGHSTRVRERDSNLSPSGLGISDRNGRTLSRAAQEKLDKKTAKQQENEEPEFVGSRETMLPARGMYPAYRVSESGKRLTTPSIYLNYGTFDVYPDISPSSRPVGRVAPEPTHGDRYRFTIPEGEFAGVYSVPHDAPMTQIPMTRVTR